MRSTADGVTATTAVDEGRSRAGAPPVLDVVDLSTTIETPRGAVRPVDGVSLRLEPGRVLGIVGESGSGKTLLARSIMRLLPRHGVTSTGSVRFQGRELVQMPERNLRKLWGAQLGMVFQDSMTTLNPVVKVGRQITEVLRHHRDVGRAEARARAVGLLRSVGIPEPERRLDAYPHQLSGGMRQRVAIAIALSCDPALLVADEPTTALDVTIQAQILALLRKEQRERSMSMILVNHDLGVVAANTDHVAVLYAGKIVERAPTRTLFSGFRMPYTAALVAAQPRLSDPRHARLDAIPGHAPSLLAPSPGCRFAPRCRSARSRCHEEEPPLVPGEDPAHAFACWFPLHPGRRS